MEIIDLEMIPGGPKKICHASQYDDGRVIRFNLKENGQPIALSGSETIQAIIRKPDGSETTLNIANTFSTYVDLITEADTCDIAGVNHCEMKITEDGEDLGSGNFDMKVEEDAYGGGDITTGEASGEIASFETNIKDDLIECVCEINPEQDLHGYDHPWPAGGGKNLFNASEDNIVEGSNICTISGNVITNTGANAYDAVRFEQPLKDGNYVLHASNISANGILQVQYYDGSYHDLGYMSANSLTLTFIMPANATLRISLYSSEAGGMSVTELQCELGLTPSAYEPYSNICPISGFTGLDIMRASEAEKSLWQIDDEFKGKVEWNQLADKNIIRASGSSEGLTITNNGDGSLSFTGTATSSNWILLITNYLPSVENHKYLIDINTDNTLQISDGYYFKNIINWNHGGQTIGLYVKPQANTAYNEKIYIVCIDLTQLFGSTIADYIYNLEQTTPGAGVAFFRSIYPEEYSPYDAGTPTHIGERAGGVNFGQTVYEGELTCKDGKWHWKGTHGYHRVLSTDIIGEYLDTDNGQYLARYTPSDPPKRTGSPAIAGDVISNILTNKDQGLLYRDIGNSVCVMGDAGRFRLTFENCDTFEKMQTFLTNNETTLCYELATPIEIDLTGDQVETIIGKNNLYHTANGETAVKFYIRS